MNESEVVEILSRPHEVKGWQWAIMLSMTALGSLGVFLNCYVIWLIRTRLELSTFINSLISVECCFRVLDCGIILPIQISFLVVGWTPQSVYRLAFRVLPTTVNLHEFICFIPSCANFTSSFGNVIFNMLTNIIRSSYVLSELRSRGSFQMTRKRWIQNFVILGGIALTFMHLMLTAYTMKVTDLPFATKCLNILESQRTSRNASVATRGGEIYKGTLSLSFLIQDLIMELYQLVSISFLFRLAYVIYQQDHKSMLNKPSTQLPSGPKRRRNLYAAITGFAHVIVIILSVILQLITRDLFGKGAPVKHSGIFLAFFMLTLHGVVSPGFMFWASSDARRSSKALLKDVMDKIISLVLFPKRFIIILKKNQMRQNQATKGQTISIPISPSAKEKSASNPDSCSLSNGKENSIEPIAAQVTEATKIVKIVPQLRRDPMPPLNAAVKTAKMLWEARLAEMDEEMDEKAAFSDQHKRCFRSKPSKPQIACLDGDALRMMSSKVGEALVHTSNKDDADKETLESASQLRRIVEDFQLSKSYLDCPDPQDIVNSFSRLA